MIIGAGRPSDERRGSTIRTPSLMDCRRRLLERRRWPWPWPWWTEAGKVPIVGVSDQGVLSEGEESQDEQVDPAGEGGDGAMARAPDELRYGPRAPL